MFASNMYQNEKKNTNGFNFNFQEIFKKGLSEPKLSPVLSHA